MGEAEQCARAVLLGVIRAREGHEVQGGVWREGRSRCDPHMFAPLLCSALCHHVICVIVCHHVIASLLFSQRHMSRCAIGCHYSMISSQNDAELSCLLVTVKTNSHHTLVGHLYYLLYISCYVGFIKGHGWFHRLSVCHFNNMKHLFKDDMTCSAA